MRDKVSAGEIDQVILTDPDRLARNDVHQMVLLEEFENHGCQIAFLDRPISQDPHDQLLLQIRGAVAEYQRTLIAERMRRGRQSKYRAGVLLPWSKPPYGYREPPDHPRNPSGVQIQEAEAAVVREMFACYLGEDISLYGLVQHLHEWIIRLYGKTGVPARYRGRSRKAAGVKLRPKWIGNRPRRNPDDQGPSEGTVGYTRCARA